MCAKFFDNRDLVEAAYLYPRDVGRGELLKTVFQCGVGNGLDFAFVVLVDGDF